LRVSQSKQTAAQARRMRSKLLTIFGNLTIGTTRDGSRRRARRRRVVANATHSGRRCICKRGGGSDTRGTQRARPRPSERAPEVCRSVVGCARARAWMLGWASSLRGRAQPVGAQLSSSDGSTHCWAQLLRCSAPHTASRYFVLKLAFQRFCIGTPTF
jgi:hypothetical protein